ncbi:MAG: SEC-C metal-binding domain-containing protein [Pseudomonadota bacterium]
MKTPAIGRNDPCPCGSGKKFKYQVKALPLLGETVRFQLSV